VVIAVQSMDGSVLVTTDHPDGMVEWSVGNTDLPTELAPNCGAGVRAGGTYVQPGRTVFVTVGCPMLPGVP